MNDEMIFFYGGIYSQWYPSLIVVDGVEYNCCEQYMMAQKALLFNDLESYKKIMSAWHPSQQKALGRLVQGFDIDTWNQHCREIVYRGNLAKFTQHPVLKDGLLSTGHAEIVEASPTDLVWGIGLTEADDRRFDKTQWKGTNWLGEAIMRVRDTLRKEE